MSLCWACVEIRVLHLACTPCSSILVIEISRNRALACTMHETFGRVFRERDFVVATGEDALRNAGRNADEQNCANWGLIPCGFARSMRSWTGRLNDPSDSRAW
jgi:hypothetical protein